MAYLHCHNCKWSQDDFWDKWYNPIKHLQTWEKELLDFDKLDEEIDSHLVKKTYREVIAQACEAAARDIREMVYLKFDNTKDQKCPKCGGWLDVD